MTSDCESPPAVRPWCPAPGVVVGRRPEGAAEVVAEEPVTRLAAVAAVVDAAVALSA